MHSAGYTSLNIEYVFRELYRAIVDAHFSSMVSHSTIVWAWQIVTFVGLTISAMALFLIVYTIMRISDIRKREAEKYGPIPILDDSVVHENPRWNQVQEYIASDNQNDWRQAIIESDIILGEILTTQGYQGDSIGEQLKQIEQSDFDTLNDAWEAHKVRNEIAHAGSDFALSDTLARRTIARYKNVFSEFEAI